MSERTDDSESRERALVERMQAAHGFESIKVTDTPDCLAVRVVGLDGSVFEGTLTRSPRDKERAMPLLPPLLRLLGLRGDVESIRAAALAHDRL